MLKAGYSKATIRRAKESLNIKSTKEGGNFGGLEPKWLWALPAAEDAQGDQHNQDSRVSQKELREGVQQENMSTFSKFEHLQHEEDSVEEEI